MAPETFFFNPLAHAAPYPFHTLSAKWTCMREKWYPMYNSASQL